MGENADLVRSMYESYNSGDRSHVADFMDPDVTWDFTEAPDGNVYNGTGAVEGFLAMLDDVWESIRIEILAQEERGDIVISSVRVVGRGKGSGVGVEQPEWHMWRVREGKLIEGKTYLDPDWESRA
jgi:ketosteroid isomerase-like protein